MQQFQDLIDSKIDKAENKTVEERWVNLKTCVLESADIAVGCKSGNVARKPCVTDEMLQKMDERRKWKNTNTEEGKNKYKQLNNELRRETEKARDDWWNEQCEELQS